MNERIESEGVSLSSHPVDVVKALLKREGIKYDTNAMSYWRDLCDRPVSALEFVRTKTIETNGNMNTIDNTLLSRRVQIWERMFFATIDRDMNAQVADAAKSADEALGRFDAKFSELAAV
jgi:hypothetical protein